MHSLRSRKTFTVGLVFKTVSRLPPRMTQLVDFKVIDLGFEQSDGGNIRFAIRSISNNRG
ncbi:Uncharacterised protein [Yokenella regensburgei]|nr:Uncharacterised protein [Yokenella regensburgei]